MKKCKVCQKYGRVIMSTQQDAIYQSRGEPTMINLCYSHSVELFKMGQTNFVSKYILRPSEYDESHPKEVVAPASNYFLFNSMV